MADANVPTLDGLGPTGGLDHTEHEYAEVATFAPRIGVVAGLVAAVEAGLLAHLAVRMWPRRPWTTFEVAKRVAGGPCVYGLGWSDSTK